MFKKAGEKIYIYIQKPNLGCLNKWDYQKPNGVQTERSVYNMDQSDYSSLL